MMGVNAHCSLALVILKCLMSYDFKKLFFLNRLLVDGETDSIRNVSTKAYSA